MAESKVRSVFVGGQCRREGGEGGRDVAGVWGVRRETRMDGKIKIAKEKVKEREKW